MPLKDIFIKYIKNRKKNIDKINYYKFIINNIKLTGMFKMVHFETFLKCCV